jgi:hypothetical protein
MQAWKTSDQQLETFVQLQQTSARCHLGQKTQKQAMTEIIKSAEQKNRKTPVSKIMVTEI